MSHLQLVLQFNLVLMSRWLREAGNVILFMTCLLLLLPSRGQRNEKEWKSFVTLGEWFSQENAFNQMKILSQDDAVWTPMIRYHRSMTPKTDCRDSWPERVVIENFEVRDIVIGLAFIIDGWSRDSSTKAAANFVAKCAANFFSKMRC